MAAIMPQNGAVPQAAQTGSEIFVGAEEQGLGPHSRLGSVAKRRVQDASEATLSRPGINDIDAATLEILCIAGRDTCPTGACHAGDHRVELADRSASCAARSSDFGVGIGGIVVETQDSLREVFVEDRQSGFP